MPIITISRQTGTYGSEIANKLAEELNAPLLDKERMIATAKNIKGFSTDLIEHFDEKSPAFWDNFSNKKYQFISFLKNIILESALEGNSIIFGRGGAVVLKDIPGVLHIQLIGSEEVRSKVLVEKAGGTERHALKSIHHSDNLRNGFHHFFFHTEWRDPDHYDLIININNLSPERIVHIIKNALPSTEDEKKGISEIKNRLLAEKVKQTIVNEEHFAIDLLEVTSKDGVVTLTGITGNSEVINQCIDIAKSYPGVKEVINDMQIISQSVPYIPSI